MKRKNLETLVLAVGIIIILIALFFMFLQPTTAQSIFIVNIVFSLGFVVYIIYSIMTTNSLNREISGLNNHVSGLKAENSKKAKLLDERQTQITALEEESGKKDKDLQAANKKIADLEKQMTKRPAAKPDSKK